MGKPRSLIRYVKDRPATTARYAIDSSKIERELGCGRASRSSRACANQFNGTAEHPEWVKKPQWRLR